jgi:hypothetical protein
MDFKITELQGFTHQIGHLVSQMDYIIRKAEGLCTEAGGIRRTGLEGALCLLGRFGL